MDTSVNAVRPGTASQGLSSARSNLKSAGPSRQVQDPTFYIGLLREKSQELQAEIEKFKKEKADFEQDSQLYDSQPAPATDKTHTHTRATTPYFFF